MSDRESLSYAAAVSSSRHALFAWLSLAVLLSCIPWLFFAIGKTVSAFYFARDTHWTWNVMTSGVTVCLGLLGSSMGVLAVRASPKRRVGYWVMIVLHGVITVWFAANLLSFVVSVPRY